MPLCPASLCKVVHHLTLPGLAKLNSAVTLDHPVDGGWQGIIFAGSQMPASGIAVAASPLLPLWTCVIYVITTHAPSGQATTVAIAYKHRQRRQCLLVGTVTWHHVKFRVRLWLVVIFFCPHTVTFATTPGLPTSLVDTKLCTLYYLCGSRL